MYHWDFGLVWSYRWLLLDGLGVTVAFTIAIVVLGLAIGLLAGLAKLSPFRPVGWLASAYIEVFRCTPVLVQLIWFYYAMPILTGIEMSAFTAGILALSLYGGSFYAEIIRGGIVSIDRGQTEAGEALGMVPSQIMRRVVLPQALKRMVPPLMNQSIIQFKNTSLVSVISVADLAYMAAVVNGQTYRPLESYTVMALLYIVMLLPITQAADWIEKRLRVSD